MELEKIREVTAQVMDTDLELITAGTTFVDDLGADSLDIFQIMIEIETQYDIEIDSETAEGIRTVGDAADVVRRALGK